MMTNFMLIDLCSRHLQFSFGCFVIRASFVSTEGATAYSNAFYGRGSGSIYLDNVGCTGTESRLVDCSHRGIGVHDCSHYEDAGLSCQGALEVYK